MEPNYQGNDKNVIGIKQPDSLFGYFCVVLSGIKECLFRSYDVLVILKTPPLSFPCALIAKLRRKKVVIDMDDLDSALQTKISRKILIAFLENLVPGYADMVTTHSDYIIELLKRKKIKKIVKMAQGVDTALFDPSRYNRQLLRQALGLSGKKVLVYLATLTWGGCRDLDIILKAVRDLMQNKPDLFLLIVGGGPLEGHFLQIIKELKMGNVRITGLLPQEEVPRYLSAADIALIFMRDDLGNRMRASLKLLEYLSMEKIVVGHIVGESKDMLGQYCSLSDPTAESLTAKISDACEGKAILESAREYIKNNHSWQKIGEKMVEAMAGWGK